MLGNAENQTQAAGWEALVWYLCAMVPPSSTLSLPYPQQPLLLLRYYAGCSLQFFYLSLFRSFFNSNRILWTSFITVLLSVRTFGQTPLNDLIDISSFRTPLIVWRPARLVQNMRCWLKSQKQIVQFSPQSKNFYHLGVFERSHRIENNRLRRIAKKETDLLKIVSLRCPKWTCHVEFVEFSVVSEQFTGECISQK